MTKALRISLAGSVLIIALTSARVVLQNNGIAGYTNSPGEQNCTACHSSLWGEQRVSAEECAQRPACFYWPFSRQAYLGLLQHLTALRDFAELLGHFDQFFSLLRQECIVQQADIGFVQANGSKNTDKFAA